VLTCTFVVSFCCFACRCLLLPSTSGKAAVSWGSFVRGQCAVRQQQQHQASTAFPVLLSVHLPSSRGEADVLSEILGGGRGPLGWVGGEQLGDGGAE
jgi:hypothetical protein